MLELFDVKSKHSVSTHDKVSINREAWSEQSKQSYAYHYIVKYYEDIKYNCVKCHQSVIFSVVEQKESFEVKKSYIWQRRCLCPSCFDALNDLRQKISEFESLWASESEPSKPNAAYLQNWLDSLNEIRSYGKPINKAMISKLTKLLKDKS